MVWPGYSPPSTGSSTNSGTHPLTSYTDLEDDIREAYAADGWDTTQEPPQNYSGWTNQRRNEPEAHVDPTAPGKPTVAATGTAGEAQVTWTASYTAPSGGYTVQASSGQSKHVGGNTLTAKVTGLTPSDSVTFTVDAIGANATATSAASNSYTVP